MPYVSFLAYKPDDNMIQKRGCEAGQCKKRMAQVKGAAGFCVCVCMQEILRGGARAPKEDRSQTGRLPIDSILNNRKQQLLR